VAAPSPRRSIAHYAAPGAFLLGATILALLIHSALGGKGIGPSRTTTPVGPVTRASTASIPAHTTRTVTRTGTTVSSTSTGSEYTTVQTGDTFFSIASRSGTTVAAIEGLNPGVSSNALQVGQRIRVK
jgi:LysM repeat protein